MTSFQFPKTVVSIQKVLRKNENNCLKFWNNGVGICVFCFETEDITSAPQMLDYSTAIFISLISCAISLVILFTLSLSHTQICKSKIVFWRCIWDNFGADNMPQRKILVRYLNVNYFMPVDENLWQQIQFSYYRINFEKRKRGLIQEYYWGMILYDFFRLNQEECL